MVGIYIDPYPQGIGVYDRPLPLEDRGLWIGVYGRGGRDVPEEDIDPDHRGTEIYRIEVDRLGGRGDILGHLSPPSRAYVSGTGHQGRSLIARVVFDIGRANVHGDGEVRRCGVQ